MFNFKKKPKEAAKTDWRTPGKPYWVFCKEVLDETNVLIAGCAGSGKSEFLHTLLYTMFDRFLPCKDDRSAKVILCDPKRVELSVWKNMPHVIRYANTYDDIMDALDYAIGLMEWRYEDMERRNLRKWDGSRVYVVIDELGDMMTTNKRRFSAQMTKLMQLSRAAGIHVIACTQSPSKMTIPASAQINYTCCIGLRCKSAIESRQVIGTAGCESLPRYGRGIMSSPDGLQYCDIPMTPADDIQWMLAWWDSQK